MGALKEGELEPPYELWKYGVAERLISFILLNKKMFVEIY